MLYPRIIPCLLIHKNGLYKTVQFNSPKYIGDPINAVKIFNEKEVDELIVIDIDSTVNRKDPDYKLIEKLAIECRMPICYGGGVKTIEQANKIFNLGVEKIAVSSIAVENRNFISELSNKVGKQSVVVVLDVKKNGSSYELYTNNGKKAEGINPFLFAEQMQVAGAGEIMINSIDHDGMMKGYDEILLNKICQSVSIPITILGGAGNLDDLGKAIFQNGTIGVSAGSLFVFKGKFKAVLINYPNTEEKNQLFEKYFINKKK